MRDPDVLDTWFSSAAVAVRDARLARRHARAARLLPDRRPLDGARHPLPVGRPHGDDGPRVHRRGALPRRLLPLGHPRAGRPPDEQVAGHRASTRSTRSTGTAPTRCAWGCWRCPPPRTSSTARRRSSRARPWPTSSSTPRASCSGASARTPSPPRAPRRSRTAGSSAALQRATGEARERLEAFDFAKAALGLYDFVYGELCDWYLELIKDRDVDDDLSATLLHLLRETLGLAHPIIPFVTEELWGHVPGTDGLLAAARYPGVEPALVDPEAELQVAAVIEAVTAVRSWRNQAGVRPGERLPARLAAQGYEDTAALVARLARLELDGPRRRRPGAGSRSPAACSRSCPGDPEEAGAQARRRARAARGRGPPGRGPARQRGLRREGPGASRGGGAAQARAPPARAGGAVSPAARRAAPAPAGRGWTPEDAERHLLSLELFGMRFGLDRMRRLLTVLGSPQAALPRDPRRGDERQVVDDADGRGDPARPRAAHRRLPVAAPRLLRRARPRRRRGRHARRPAAAAVQRAAAAAEKVERTGADDDRVTQFELADRGRVRPARRRRASRWPSSRRAWAAAGTRRTCSTAPRCRC